MNDIYKTNNNCKNIIVFTGFSIFSILFILYFITGLVFVIREYKDSENCVNSNLGNFAIISLLFFWISIIFKCFKYQDDINNDIPLIIYIIFFIGNLILFIWGYVETFLQSKNCEVHKKNLWYFGLVSSNLNLFIVLIMLIFFF